MDDIFGFLPSMVGGQEGQAPAGFEVRDQDFLTKKNINNKNNSVW